MNSSWFKTVYIIKKKDIKSVKNKDFFLHVFQCLEKRNSECYCLPFSFSISLSLSSWFRVGTIIWQECAARVEFNFFNFIIISCIWWCFSDLLFRLNFDKILIWCVFVCSFRRHSNRFACKIILKNMMIIVWLFFCCSFWGNFCDE